NRSPVPNDARVTLSATASTGGTVTLYSDDQCTVSTAGVTMPGGTASASFWFKDDLSATALSETIPITAGLGAVRGGVHASQDEAVTARRAVGLRYYSLPQDLSVGLCSATTTVGLVDAAGNRIPASSSTAVTLSTPPGLVLYVDAACAQPAQFIVFIPAGG